MWLIMVIPLTAYLHISCLYYCVIQFRSFFFDINTYIVHSKLLCEYKIYCEEPLCTIKTLLNYFRHIPFIFRSKPKFVNFL